MDLKDSSSNSGDLSPSEEQEFSDDDDRNHKHRRREAEAHTQSLNKDKAMDQEFSRPFRKRNKPYENVPFSRISDPQFRDGFSSRFERRRPGPEFSSFSRPPLDLNQRYSVPQNYLGASGHGIGRGGDPWSQGDLRYSSVNATSQVVHQGSFLPNLLSNSQNPSWSAFGMIPRVPNGGFDAFHSHDLPGSVRPPMNPSLSIGIPRQRCIDFEERGFCLRGDMCPMDHGINRIVVEDVQSLSQFNLPASLPNAHLMGTATGPISTPSLTAPSNTCMNNKVLHSKIVKPCTLDNGLSGADEPDFYDPDQPLWNNDCPDASFPGPPLNTFKNDEFNTSIWKTRGGSELKEETDSNINLPDQLVDDIKENEEEDSGFKNTKFSNKMQSGHLHNNTRKPFPKALRTLFVNFIPQKNNKKEALLLHFKKYGKVIDIYIPVNSEQAFVQFSKREEAEAALRAPDAVMGNRFIKLYWANRDRIVDDGMGSGNNNSISSHGMITPGTIRPIVSQGKYKVQTGPSMPSVSNTANVPVPTADLLKPVKKLENLELLKEELRKKQEMLDQKRNDFKLRLQKLEKQKSPGLKSKEESVEPSAKRQKTEPTTPVLKPSDPGTSGASSPRTEKKKLLDVAISPRSKTIPAMILKEPASLKRPSAPEMTTPFLMNRFKLDNRPTSFRIIPPLPAGLANVATLKEHFSSYGDLANVEFEDQEENNNTCSETLKNCSARITFKSRSFAEKAFKNGKSWQGTNLQFTWITSNNSRPGKENSLSANDGSGENLASQVSPEGINSENGKNGNNPERKNESGVDHIESDKDLKSGSIEILCDSSKEDIQ